MCAGPVALLGVRGYYLRTMGDPARNDRGIYDDAIFLFSETAHIAFNANTDPSIARPGVAVLRTGLWHYKLGTHGLRCEKDAKIWPMDALSWLKKIGVR